MFKSMYSFFRKKPKVIVILGPTSTGKTSLSVSIAQKYNGEIISADSRQVYKGLDLLSGKVTLEEKKDVEHYLLDVAELNENFSVAEYKSEATKAIEKIIEKQKTPIICGGTGFYIDTLIYDSVLPEVLPNLILRKKLEEKTTTELFKMLKQLDPRRSKNIDEKNRVRLVRALEIAQELGKSPSARRVPKSPYKLLLIGLDMDDDILKKRIRRRIDERIKNGMIEEAKTLLSQGVSKEKLLLLGLDAGYGAKVALGEMDVDEMKEKLWSDTWKYVRRQRTWWKRNENIHWFSPMDVSNIQNKIEEFLSN